MTFMHRIVIGIWLLVVTLFGVIVIASKIVW